MNFIDRLYFCDSILCKHFALTLYFNMFGGDLKQWLIPATVTWQQLCMLRGHSASCLSYCPAKVHKRVCDQGCCKAASIELIQCYLRTIAHY